MFLSQFSYPYFGNNVFLLHLLSGTDGILLGAETLRGLYPVEAIKTVGRICAEVNKILTPEI